MKYLYFKLIIIDMYNLLALGQGHLIYSFFFLETHLKQLALRIKYKISFMVG